MVCSGGGAVGSQHRHLPLIAPLVGGAGGGRPDFAEAGGKQPEKIDDLLAAAPAAIEKLLHGR